MANSVRSKPIGDPPRSGSPLRRCGRSTVVFTEGVDSGPMDWGSASEACEIGGLGTLACGPAGRNAREGGVLAGLRRRDDLNRSVTNSGRGAGVEPQYPLPRVGPLGSTCVGQLPG